MMRTIILLLCGISAAAAGAILATAEASADDSRSPAPSGAPVAEREITEVSLLVQDRAGDYVLPLYSQRHAAFWTKAGQSVAVYWPVSEFPDAHGPYWFSAWLNGELIKDAESNYAGHSSALLKIGSTPNAGRHRVRASLKTLDGGREREVRYQYTVDNTPPLTFVSVFQNLSPSVSVPVRESAGKYVVEDSGYVSVKGLDRESGLKTIACEYRIGDTVLPMISPEAAAETAEASTALPIPALGDQLLVCRTIDSVGNQSEQTAFLIELVKTGNYSTPD